MNDYLSFESVKEDWKPFFKDFFTSNIGIKLAEKIENDLRFEKEIFPPRVFRAFELLEKKNVRVIILGQDPYHEKHQAAGLAFHVEQGIPVPPSLKNIFQELQRDLHITKPVSGSLLGWVSQGVLLLNSILTVQEGLAASHAKYGWETFTDSILQALSDDPSPKVFLLWGNFARSKIRFIDSQKHLVLQSNHPSPLSARKPPIPFIGNSHFSQTNHWLTQKGFSPIDWAKLK